MIRPPVRRAGAAESGNMLAAVYLALVPVIGIVSTLFLRSTAEVRMHESRKNEVRAVQRALAAIEAARNEVTNSTYTSAHNDRITLALAQTTLASARPDPHGTPGMYLALDTQTGERILVDDPAALAPGQQAFRLLRTIDFEDDLSGEADDGDDKVSVYVVPLTGLWHMIEARATVNGISRTGRVLVRERDPFTRYGIFINSHYQGISGSPKGDIHTNRTLQIFYPGSVFDDFVSARDSFQWMIGASAANTTFNAGYSVPNPNIPMPSLNDIQGIRPFATGSYYVNNLYKDTEITFQGTNVLIRAKLISNNVVYTLHNGPLPPQGVIYSEGNIKSVQGDVNGRVTVATASATGTKIAGSIRYVDGDGDPAMLNPTTPENYIHNPAYDGNSSVGIVSLGPVLYASTIPMTIELHAAIFCSAGHVGLPGLSFTSNGAYCTGYDPTFQKTNLNVLGCTISDRRWVGTVVNSSGAVLSGFQDGYIEYDRELLNKPPPHFLEIDRPMFKAVEIVENLVDL